MNKEYNLKLDLQFRCNNSKMIFDEFDENTSDFFMQISRQGQEVDISNAIPTLLVLKPSGTAASQVLNIKDNLVYGNLNNSLKNEVGTYIAKLMLVEGDKKTFISNISYEVTENALLGKIDNDIVEDERYSVLLQLIERLSNIELQEQTRVDNENSRVEAEQNREQTFQNLQDEVKDLLDKGLDLSNLVTKEELNELSEELEIHTHNEYATKEEIPTKISELENDKKYLTKIPSEYVTETELNQKGYLTEHQDISGKADKTELHTHTNKTVLDGITSVKVQSWDNKSTFDGNYNSLTNKPSIPTKTSQLTNDSKFITTIPSEYVTETELNNKGYLTEHQDISNKVDKVSGKGLSTNDYTTSEKNKLAGIEAGANNVKVYTAKECTTFTSDDGTCTPLAVQKAVGLFPPKEHEHSQYVTETELNAKGYATVNQINNKADKVTGVFYIEGDSTTAGVWTGQHEDITEYYLGLMINYKTNVAGASGGSTLNINNLGAVQVVRNVSTAVTTTYTVGCIINLTYTVDNGTAYWKVADYDVNTKNTAGTSNKTGSKMFIVGATSQTSSGTTTYTNTNCYIGTDNKLYSGGNKVVDINELEAKGYLTEHQDISGLATKEYVDNAITNLNIDIDYDSLLSFDTNEIITNSNYVDSDNNIILDDDLPAGAYTLKYEFEDGTLTDIREFTIEGGHN